MVNTGKLYYIIDMSGNFYKVKGKQGLTMVNRREDADIFSLKEANARIGGGKKAKFFTTLEADVTPDFDVVEANYSDREYDTVDKPTMFDGLNNNWEEILTNLCYMSEHIEDYILNLNSMLSDVDKEICDIMHFLELNELDDSDMLMASRMLQERRRYRRDIKDELEKTVFMKSTFLDGSFSIKAHQSLEFMGKMNSRQYTPRKLNELFINRLTA